LGDKSFAGAGLTLDEHRGGAAGAIPTGQHAPDTFAHGTYRGTFAEQLG